MSSSVCKIFIFPVIFYHIIQGLDVCEDKSNDCQTCNLQYPVPSPTRENCMKTCQVCTDDENVALKQTTKQLTGHIFGESYKAVDGNTNGEYYEGSCTHTRNTPITQWWCVHLKRIYNIIKIMMYNRDNPFGERIQGFELKTSSSGQCNEAGFNTSSPCYKNDPPTNQRVYTIDRCNQDSNKSIVAGTLFVSVTGQPLTICEFRVFTGTSCSYGYYSASNSTCEPCNDGCSDNKCNPDTGDCIGVCKSGFYGTKCNKACSQGCSTPDCKRDGSCTVCKPGWYGDNCESRCPTGCKGTCNKTSGTCDECKEGTVGLYCYIKCGEECRTMTEEEKRWSICKEGDCKKNCGDKYYGKSSVIISRCNYFCIGGRKSETCLRVEEISVYEDSISPVTASSIGVIVGLIVGVAVTGLICWLCCIRRRQPGDLQDTRTEQRRHNNSISKNQPSTIIQNEAFLSDQETNIYDNLDHTDVQNDTYTNTNISLTNK